METVRSRVKIDYGRSSPAWYRAVPRWLAIVAIVVGAGYLSLKMIGRAMSPTVAMSATRAQASAIADLPGDASRISYRIGGAFDPCPATYEFAVSEAGFRAWAEKKAFTLRRGRTATRRFDQTRIEIADGLFGGIMTGADSGFHVAYDLATGTAHYYSHSR